MKHNYKPTLFHTLYFEATRHCNFNCPHCSSGSQQKSDYQDIPFDIIIKNILDPAWDLGTRFVDFSGGEFLLRPDAIELVEYANQKGFRIGIASNGTTLNDKTLVKLKEAAGDNLLISLGINSFDEDNKATRCSDQDYFINTLNRLEKHHINVNVAVTMGSFNADSFGNTVTRLKEMYLPMNRIPFVPRHSSETSLMFDKEIMKSRLHEHLANNYKAYVSFVPFFLNPDKYTELTGQTKDESPVTTNPSVGCWCGSFYSIGPDGEVSPCPLLGDHLSGGNIYKNSLYSILYESELFTRIVDRNHFNGKCGTCKYNFVCGGCRAYTYYLTGDVFGSDPTCFIDELSEEELAELEKKFEKNFKNYIRMAKVGGLCYINH